MLTPLHVFHKGEAAQSSCSVFLPHFFLSTIMSSSCSLSLSGHPWDIKQGLKDAIVYPQAPRAPRAFCHRLLLLWWKDRAASPFTMVNGTSFPWMCYTILAVGTKPQGSFTLSMQRKSLASGIQKMTENGRSIGITSQARSVL